MIIYVNAAAGRDGNGTKERPFRFINDAAQAAHPGDEVLVAPGVYREYVNPRRAGKKNARITYRSTEPLGAVITGAEEIKNWKHYEGNVWVCRVSNSVFGDYNPYTTYVYGDWYFAGKNKHTGAVYLNDQMLYEADSLDACLKGEVYECSWNPEASVYKWYSEQDTAGNGTMIYANFQGKNPNEEKVEINVRRECFFPEKTGRNYITVSGFRIEKAATTWAPPAAFQDGMIGPHWSKGWIIEDCDISNSKCAGISLGKYLDPDNDHYFTTKHIKSPTQMERDAVCRGQYHGWLKEKVGSHIIRRCNIHHCEQDGICGRMGGVFSPHRGQPYPSHQQHDGTWRRGDRRHQDARGHRRHFPPQLHSPLYHGDLVRLGGPGRPHHPKPLPRQPASGFCQTVKGKYDEPGSLRGSEPRPYPHRQ